MKSDLWEGHFLHCENRMICPALGSVSICDTSRSSYQCASSVILLQNSTYIWVCCQNMIWGKFKVVLDFELVLVHNPRSVQWLQTCLCEEKHGTSLCVSMSSSPSHKCGSQQYKCYCSHYCRKAKWTLVAGAVGLFCSTEGKFILRDRLTICISHFFSPSHSVIKSGALGFGVFGFLPSNFCVFLIRMFGQNVCLLKLTLLNSLTRTVLIYTCPCSEPQYAASCG